jgi:hypothetical protein
MIIRPFKGKQREWELVFLDLEWFAWLPAWTQAVALLTQSQLELVGKENWFNAMLQDFCAPYKEEVDAHFKMERWAGYPI